MKTTSRPANTTSRCFASAGIAIAFFASGIGSAAADDYSSWIIDPNVVVDTVAYTASVPAPNPGGMPGATVVYNHRDGRTITDSVWLLADPAAAQAAAAQAQSAVTITNATTESVAVGNGGQFISGTSADGSRVKALLTFTEGNAASSIEFTGPVNDPVPASLAIELGGAQDALIKTKLGI